jgi:hypothetical protein
VSEDESREMAGICGRSRRGGEKYGLGFRRLRDLDYYGDDPMVRRLMGLKRLPNVSTISRQLAEIDRKAVDNVHTENRCLVLNRLVAEALPRVTLDFDGSVQSTRSHAEGTAVGYNKKRKGARSYYPLFCTSHIRDSFSTCSIVPAMSMNPTVPPSS